MMKKDCQSSSTEVEGASQGTGSETGDRAALERKGLINLQMVPETGENQPEGPQYSQLNGDKAVC